MGSDLEVEYGPDRGVNAVPRRLADTSAASADLGFTSEIGLEEGLTRLVEWWREQELASAQPAAPVPSEAAL